MILSRLCFFRSIPCLGSPSLKGCKLHERLCPSIGIEQNLGTGANFQSQKTSFMLCLLCGVTSYLLLIEVNEPTGVQVQAICEMIFITTVRNLKSFQTVMMNIERT